jgi:hypothetical protein
MLFISNHIHNGEEEEERHNTLGEGICDSNSQAQAYCCLSKPH